MSSLEYEVRKRLSEAEGKTAEGEPKELYNLGRKFTKRLETLGDYWYNRGIQDLAEWILPYLAKQRRVKEWLKDWTLSAPLDDIEAFCNGDAKIE